MIKLSREFKTGIVVVVVTILFVWGFNYLKGYNLFDGPSNSYFTEYDNVQGLNTASMVTINGYEVGKVVDITFNKDPLKRGELIVEFTVENDFEFSKNSIAKIYSASLMGGKSLAVIPSYEGDQAVPGNFLQGEIESDMFSSFGEKLNPLQAKLENVIVSADSLLVHLNNVMDKETINNIKKSIGSFEETMSNLKNTSKTADELLTDNKSTLSSAIKNAENITANFSKISDSLSSIKFNELVDKIKVTVVNLETMTEGINNGKGTVGKLMNDETVYINLANATKELEELLKEVKLHPKRFVHFSLFGKKEKEYEDEVEEVE
jgi:phospholipid/cholesterol/gamma-HCH transport system substrate-binding protein